MSKGVPCYKEMTQLVVISDNNVVALVDDLHDNALKSFEMLHAKFCLLRSQLQKMVLRSVSVSTEIMEKSERDT